MPQIWDATTYTPLGKLLADHGVASIAIGRAGDRDIIVTGSEDGTVQIWDAVTGVPVGKPLAGHGSTVTSIAIGRAGSKSIIVTGSADKSMIVREHRP
jgi:WD40 repeat protein